MLIIQTLQFARGVPPVRFPQLGLGCNSSYTYRARPRGLEFVVLVPPQSRNPVGEAMVTVLPQPGGSVTALSSAFFSVRVVWFLGHLCPWRDSLVSPPGSWYKASCLEPLIQSPVRLGELPTPSHASGARGHTCGACSCPASAQGQLANGQHVLGEARGSPHPATSEPFDSRALSRETGREGV